MKFKDLPYQRPDIKLFAEQFNLLLNDFNESKSFTDQDLCLKEIYKRRSHFETMMNIASTRNSINTSDRFYETEQRFFDDYEPVYKGLVDLFYKSLLNSKFRSNLEEKYGIQLLRIAELTLKTFDPSIIDDLKTENQLGTEYTKLIASAKIQFDNKELNFSELIPYKQSVDRKIRQSASVVSEGYYSKISNELRNIFDQLVKVRHGIAVKLGFSNFIELGYARMLRTDYDSIMVCDYREKIFTEVVPLVNQLKTEQRQRLGLNELYYYDETIDYLDGNALPKGNAEWIVNNARKMYSELSEKTGEFMEFMVENELLDLVTKIDKASGGYCTFFSEYKSPFIFSNFNGTSADIDVLTHEAGHAFQGYCSRNLNIEEYYFPTYEACEIHSMSMEFITWPWMNLFFESETDKYYFSHLSHSLSFLPYGVCVDEFQHWVYENYEATPDQRDEQWRVIEKKYLPHRNYDGNNYLENGGFWHRQSHIFKTPFYYIDYTLAQVCAFQFWKKSKENLELAMIDYVRLCEAGGSKSFLQLVKLANLKSPFDSGTVKEIVSEVNSWLVKNLNSKLTAAE